MAARLSRVVPGVPVLLGGTHPTFSHEFIRHPAVSLMLVGEAEVACAELAERIESGKDLRGIPGIWLKEGNDVYETGPAPRVEDLDALPLPDRALYYRYPFMRAFPWKKFSTGRGCVNSCSFCYNSFVRELYGGKGFVRRKSPERVVREVEEAVRLSRVGWVHFADDLFVTYVDWLERFSEVYPRSLRLPFSCNSSADRMTAKAASLLARAGCRVVAVGVETASQDVRIRVLNKPATNAVIESAARHISAAGMRMVSFAMVGLPGEDLLDASRTLRYTRRIGPIATRVLMAMPLPGTPMARDAGAGAEERDFPRDPFGPYYSVPEPAAMETLVNIAPLASALPERATLALARLLPRKLTRPLRLWMSLQEKSIYGFSLLDGVRFYLHTGSPARRTTNYVSLI